MCSLVSNTFVWATSFLGHELQTGSVRPYEDFNCVFCWCRIVQWKAKYN